MDKLKVMHFTIISISLITALFSFEANTVKAEDSVSNMNLPEGIYLELTRDFYEALRNDGFKGERVYSNDPSADYLREISISSRFMVETNLQILKQQERIIQLLRETSKENKK